MVSRRLEPHLRAAARRFRVVTLTGPRQSGKTTLCRSVFGDKPYASLEAPDTRAFARADPRGFLAQWPEGALLDEIQYAPELLSYVQERVDASPRRGQYVLTGSQQLGLLSAVSQSLAGRTAVLHLLPLGLDEVRRFRRKPSTLYATLLTGSYPEVHERRLPPAAWYASYVATYLERDVRAVVRVADLAAFQTFLRLVAGRAGQILNLSSLGADAGVSQPTARAWLSVLEAGFVVFRLPPLHRNLNKRLTKSPKLYFYDTGLCAWLLGVRREDDLAHHPLRGALFENFVVSEILKARVHQGLEPSLHFYREQSSREVDVVLDDGLHLALVEIKSGQTVPDDAFAALSAVERVVRDATVGAPPASIARALVYGGDRSFTRSEVRVVAWPDVPSESWGARAGPRRVHARPRATAHEPAARGTRR